MKSRPEIDLAVQEGRDLTESERLSFGLDEMALNVRHWLRWTSEQYGQVNDIHFPMRPTVRQFRKWADTMEAAAEEMRRMRGTA